MQQPQSVDLLFEIPCYKCIILEPTRAPPENCDPNQCQAMTDWIMNEAHKYQQQQLQEHTITAAPRTHK